MSASALEFRDGPLAYFITFRGYGTWLHGDGRGSIDRNHNRFGTPRLPPNARRRELNYERLTSKPVRLSKKAREVVERAIREICRKRRWDLWAVNARTNHVHVVVTASCDADRVLIALKASATKKLREAGLCSGDVSPWARRGSKRRLWTEQDVINASVYVEYEQGE